MTESRTEKFKEILHKQEMLDNARTILKQEFIGIDTVIDEVVDGAGSWFLFPEFQDKPVVINLWGLTGVGKTSLVARLAELIGFKNKFYPFDLGEGGKNNQVKGQLEEIFDNQNGFPVILSLDEFQHARTIDEEGTEVEKPFSRIIWQLLDSGKFQIARFSFQIDEIYDLLLKLKFLVKNGVKVSNGKVTARKEYFLEQMEIGKELRDGKSEDNGEGDILFIPSYYYDAIYSLAKEKFSNIFEVREKVLQLNARDTLRFLYDIFTIANSTKTVDCSKGLIFVLGNLDEAYTMSNNFSPDLDPDEFHEQSLKISITDIKKALQKRFRNEQISRLGNNHIIYPAFNSDSFRKIIDLQLKYIKEKINKYHGVDVEFDSTVHKMIYDEGVYPTQGTRPIFTTIHQLIHTKLGEVMKVMILEKLKTTRIIFSADKEHIQIAYYNENTLQHTFRIKQSFNLGKLRKNKKDDLQAIFAVHEAGHAIISSVLLKSIPEVVFSNTTDSGTGGFIQTKFKWKYISRKEIQNRIALFLAGLAAEKIVFGEENVTTGAEDDIEKATVFITQMLKQDGMGKIPAAYHNKHPNTRDFIYDSNDRQSELAESWISKAMELAEKTLKEQEILLLKMADYLSDHRKMNKEMIREMLEKYARDFDMETLIENGDHLFYRKHLKEKVNKVSDTEGITKGTDAYELSLNTRYKITHPQSKRNA